MPGWFGPALFTGAAVLGALATAATGRSPGIGLGACLVSATLAAAFAVQPRSAYLLIPVPALAYAVSAAIIWMTREQAVGTSRTGLAVRAASWIGGGFLAMTAATLLAIAIVIARRTGR
jgi:uncharacterized protein DUF6542